MRELLDYNADIFLLFYELMGLVTLVYRKAMDRFQVYER